MKSLKNLVFGLLTLVSLSGAGQNPFNFDTTYKKIVLPIANAVDYGDKKVYVEKDSLGRIIFETDWYNGLRKEIKFKYRENTEDILYQKEVIRNDSTEIINYLEEYKYTYNQEGSFNLKNIVEKYDSTGKRISLMKYLGQYLPDKRPLVLMQFKDFDGDGKFDKSKKECIDYKEKGHIIRIYKLNKKGKFELYKTSPLLKD